MGQPLNGIREIGGPEQFRLDELVRKGLAAKGDPREVVADKQARYHGALLGERPLVPGPDAGRDPNATTSPPQFEVVGSVPTRQCRTRPRR